MRKTAIVNIGKLVTGDLKKDISESEMILIEGKRIKKVGNKSEIKLSSMDKIIDANGMAVIPGLIDSHVHPSIGNWTERFKSMDYYETILLSGVTSVISQGELHIKGRPKDPSGIKALAILAKKIYETFRPGGVRVYAGALLLDSKLVEEDFKELAEHGIWLIGEIGATKQLDFEELIPMINLAKKYGMKVMVHFGGKSIAGSSTVTADDVFKLKPDIVSHVNGGPIAPPLSDIKKLLEDTRFVLEVVYGGNLKIAVETVKLAEQRNSLDRVIIGSDSPSSNAGLGTLAIARMLTLIASFTGIAVSKVIAMATGNTARVFGLNMGKIEEGRQADIVILDRAEGSVCKDALEAMEYGDVFGIAAILVDGEIMFPPHRFTPLIPYPSRSVKIH